MKRKATSWNGPYPRRPARTPAKTEADETMVTASATKVLRWSRRRPRDRYRRGRREIGGRRGAPRPRRGANRPRPPPWRGGPQPWSGRGARQTIGDRDWSRDWFYRSAQG